MKEIGMKEIRKKLKPCKPQYLPFVLYAIFKLLRVLVKVDVVGDIDIIQCAVLRGRTWCYYLRTNYRGNHYSIETAIGGLTNISVSVYHRKNIVDVNVKIVKAEFTLMNRNMTFRLNQVRH